MAAVTDIESIDQFNELISNAPTDALIALNFHAPWAAPCKQMNQFAPFSLCPLYHTAANGPD